MADTITISKEYFDTLLRRSQVTEGTVTLPQYEFDLLLKSTQDYTTLRAALVRGGVDEATLDVLISGTPDGTASPKKSTQQASPQKPRPQRWSAQAAPFVPQPREHNLSTVDMQMKSEPYHEKNWQLPSPDSTSPEDFEELNYCSISPVKMLSPNQQGGYAQGDEQEEEGFYDTNHEDRSLVLKGISPFTTMADVLAVVRGGAVLNIFLRLQQRTAHVAFVEPSAAEKFLIHSNRMDIYIKGKRIEVFWDDRQNYLTGHLARRIYNNSATRNLVVRFAKTDMTEESIRDDLDHIYRLEVVGIQFEFGHAWISLNSVQQAITARSCMSSQFKYKGCRIEFFLDECSEPLPPYVKRHVQSQPAKIRSKKSTYNFNNRFATLTVDDESRSSIGIGSPVMVGN